jgi:hypothetical protein
MLLDEVKRLLRLIRLGFPFYLLRVDDLVGVWMKNTGVDTARLLDIKGRRVRRLAGWGFRRGKQPARRLRFERVGRRT